MSFVGDTEFFEGEEMYWREAKNLREGRNRYFNSVMFEAGEMTEEQAEASGVAIENARAGQASRVSPDNPLGEDLSNPEYKEFFEGFNLDERGRVVGTSFTPFELYDSAQRTGGRVWAGEAPAGAMAGTTSEDAEFASSESNDPSEEAKKGLRQAFYSALQTAGLDKETIESLWTWAEERLITDSSFTAAQALVEMYDQPAFQKRFPGITEMRKVAGRRDIPSPAEYLTREKNMQRLLQRYGLDKLPYNLDSLVSESFVSSISETELAERMNMASELIYNAPEEVKTTFEKWYGPAGEAALMATFLDPDEKVFGDWKKLTTLKSNVRTAEIGGWSEMYMGLDSPIAEETAKTIGKLGLTTADIWSNFKSIKQQEDLFAEKIGEEDLRMEVEGVAGEFGLDFDAQKSVSKRLENRQAAFAGGGGAMVTGTTTGFGGSNA